MSLDNAYLDDWIAQWDLAERWAEFNPARCSPVLRIGLPPAGGESAHELVALLERAPLVHGTVDLAHKLIGEICQ